MSRHLATSQSPDLPASSCQGNLFRDKITFRVIERFKGPDDPAPSLVFLGLSGSESFSFKVGQRVLVFAERRDADSGTNCTQTHESPPGDPMIAVLKGLRDKR